MDDQWEVTEKKKHNPVDNLKPFKPGAEWTGNAAGRPKGSRNRSTIIKELLEQKALERINKNQSVALLEDEEIKNGQRLEQQSIADQIAVSLLLKALSGDVSASRELFDSAYGKLTDKVDTNLGFTQMGRVSMQQIDTNGNPQGEGIALSFDVGRDPPQPEDE